MMNKTELSYEDKTDMSNQNNFKLNSKFSLVSSAKRFSVKIISLKQEVITPWHECTKEGEYIQAK